jgi:uncharacterized membrane protein YozB (DUF420 family)
MSGFLGTAASFRADLNLLIQIAIGILLAIGALLARTKRIRAHGACMASVLLLNLVMIGTVMWPSFHELVLPGIAKHFNARYAAVAAIHGLIGALGEMCGLYIVLVAGTNMVPERWRFRRWKLWMRLEFVSWWVVLLMGLVTYVTWYGAPHLR